MIVTEVKNADAKSNPHGSDARSLYNSENGQVVHITLNPDQGLLKHITPVDAAVYVLEGESIVEVGEEEASASKDTLVELPKEIPHSVRNSGNTPLRFLVIKMP